MLSEAYGIYTYLNHTDNVDVRWGVLTSEVVGYCTRTPLEPLTRRTDASGNTVLYSGDIPVAAESSEVLLSLVEQAALTRSKLPRHPVAIVFPNREHGTCAHEPTQVVRAAARSLFSFIEAKKEEIGVVYGYVNPLLLPHFPEPNWGGELSGLQLPDDPHHYTLRAGLGRMDLTKHDPATRTIAERIDVRTWDSLSSVHGIFQLCRQSVDLEPFLGEVRKLVDFLEDAIHEVVTISWHDVPTR